MSCIRILVSKYDRKQHVLLSDSPHLELFRKTLSYTGYGGLWIFSLRLNLFLGGGGYRHPVCGKRFKVNGCGMADLQAITDYEIFERTTCTPLQLILTQTTWWSVHPGFVSQHCNEALCMCSGLRVCKIQQQ